MKYWLQLLVGGVIIVNSTFACANGVVACDVPELVDGHSEYNALVCSGLRKMEEQKYNESVVLFEKALNIPLFETPNFELLPRLALALYRAGETKKSESVLLKAEMALSVFTGLMKCEETATGFNLRRVNGVRLTNQASHDAAAIMCGAAYDYVYDRQTLERVLLEGELVRNYFEIKRQIRPK